MTADELVALIDSGTHIWIELYPAETWSVRSALVVRLVGLRSDRIGVTMDLEDGERSWSLWRPVRMITRIRVGSSTGQTHLLAIGSY